MRIILVLLLLSCFALGQDEPLWKSLKWRSIGPYRGGRVTAVSGVVSQPEVYYFGATGGGVWKTTDGGLNWWPVSDGYFKTGSVGAIAVAQSDPNVVYVGMGESPIRGNVSHGDGVYKSTDAGKTWRAIGLENTRHIARVRIHPRNPDVVYVAALGHAFGPNPERGVFRSTDGGKSWQKVLYRSDCAGAIDLVLDPTNPNVIYAALWQVIRTPYSLESGGPDGGLFKSTDGGDTWKELTRRPGLPKGLIGKIGVAVSGVRPERVWAIIEAEDGGVFRSDDGGETWTKLSDDRNLRQRAWYYTRICADTRDADTVYVLNVNFHKSKDGGKSFTVIPTPHVDNHDLWIAPDNSQRMINGNDGGACVTTNGGLSWTELDQPTAQFYRVAIDYDFPYHIYGAQQDNTTVRIASRSHGLGIGVKDWHEVGGGESGWIAPHPKDSNIVFAGSYGGLLERYDHRTRLTRNVSVWPDNPIGAGAGEQKYRFQWNFPVMISQHEPHELYAAANVLFRSTDEGSSWQVISPDLTRADLSKLGPSGGPITKDNTGVEYYCTIFALAESPLAKGVIWAGSDDGLVHLTRDGGKSWSNVTPKGLPQWIQINSIEASPHDPAKAYLAATMYKWDDFRPYIYKTTDYGNTWVKIVDGIPDTAFTRVVREDPHRTGLLYAGTETGVYVSFDDGRKWQSLQLNLPVVPITDMAVHKRERDLVVATQGRSFWILDDLSILQQQGDWGDFYIFKPEDAYRTVAPAASLPLASTLGQNPTGGVVVYYFLKSPAKDLKIEIFDSSGALVRTFSLEAGSEDGQKDFPPPGKVTAKAGLNRFVWDMRYAEPKSFPGMLLWSGTLRGPRVVPGRYQIRITADGVAKTEDVEIKPHPNLPTSLEDYRQQVELGLRITSKLNETHSAILQIRDISKQLDELSEKLKKMNSTQLIAGIQSLKEQLVAIEESLYQTKSKSNQDPLNYPIRLNDKLASLANVVDDAEAAPTEQAYRVYESLSQRINARLGELRRVLSEEIPAINEAVRQAALPAVVTTSQ
ncbi:MAG: glycosyl hydrolase [Acidobacteriota bacterium]|nr:glycosyl hydrolase [Blastocatellia bacterium]MDW8411835.1 glycosyl hydrolase [Acidobacteriota bacterium]